MAAIINAGGVISVDGLVIGSTESGGLLKYDPAEVKLIFGAIPVHHGAAKGTFITVEREQVSWRLIKGTDGEGIRVRTQNFSARVQLTVRAGSGTNDYLSAVSATDDITGVFTVPLTLKDGSGRSLYISPLAFVESPTDVSYSDQEGLNTWAFICNTWLPFTGGLDKASKTSQFP